MDVNETRLKVVFNVLILIVSLYGISQKDYLSGDPTTFERLVINTFAPIQSTFVLGKNSVSNFFNNYFLLVGASKENKILKKEINRLKTELFKREEVVRENSRLKKLLQFSEELEQEKILAQVVGWDSSSQQKVLRINKGSSHGVKKMATVVTHNGLVGYVYQLTSRYADIITILDRNNRIDGLVSRTRSHGIVEGYGDRAIMKYVTRTEPIVLNDLVMTSGLSRIYPKGIKIGKITKIERESYGITQYIEVSPSAEFDRLEEVIVLAPKNFEAVQQEQIELDKMKENQDR